MIVYDLACPDGHRFEGWFGSSSDFAEQCGRGLVTCPVCGSAEVTKAPMAPAVGKKGNQAVAKREAAPKPKAQAKTGGKLPAEVVQAMEKLAEVQAKTLPQSEYVGDRFAEESRAIHYGEKDAKIIHGKASAKESRELLEEGITFAPLLVPFTPPEDLN